MPHTHLDVSLTIDAPAQLVFDRMNDLSRFDDWNPFPEMDPSTTTQHSGAASGVGAVFSYEGKQLGQGRMEIVSVDEPHQIDVALTFWRNGKLTGHATSSFTVAEAPGGGVDVHWTMDQERSLGLYLMGKLMFDRAMSGSFSRGLEKLKALVETN